MTYQEQFLRNLNYACELLINIIDDPLLLAHIPDGARLIAMPISDPDLCKQNMELLW